MTIKRYHFGPMQMTLKLWPCSIKTTNTTPTCFGNTHTVEWPLEERPLLFLNFSFMTSYLRRKFSSCMLKGTLVQSNSFPGVLGIVALRCKYPRWYSSRGMKNGPFGPFIISLGQNDI